VEPHSSEPVPRSSPSTGVATRHGKSPRKLATASPAVGTSHSSPTAAAQQHSGQVKQELSGAGQEMREKLREPAQQAMESVKSTANEAASKVQDESRWAGRDMKQQTQEATRNVTR
jgi:hypothetical protein